MKMSALPNGRATAPFGLVFLLLFQLQWCTSQTLAQDKPVTTKSKSTQPKTSKPKTKKAKPVDELSRLRAEFIKATNEYKELLKKQTAGLERNIVTGRGET